MNEIGPQLNPALDPDPIATAYAGDRRVHIPSILTVESAQRVHRCLDREVQFRAITRKGEGYVRVPSGVTLSPKQQAELMGDAYAKARDRFHYLYDNHPMSNNGEPYPDPSHFLAAITAFLNGTPFLDLMRRVTGSSAIRFAEAGATRYQAGHFLNQHHDSHETHGRIAAYVLNMTPFWRADWGGALLFSDQPGHISEGWLPAFNALNVFAVPQYHQVGFVSPFAGASRYSITGWLRSH